MSPLNNQIDYSSFGGTPVEEPSQNIKNNPSEEKVDYSQFGGKPVEEPKEKVGPFKSALYGLTEGVLGIPGLVQYGVNEFVDALEEKPSGEQPELSFKEKNPILSYLSTFPESEDETSRRLRVAGQVVPTLAATVATGGGYAAILAGLVGSQAGQTIREVYGENGKFKEFGKGELLAMGVDVAFGAGTNLLLSLGKEAAKKGIQAVAQKTPDLFNKVNSDVSKKVVQNALQQEEHVLKDVIDKFSQSQLREFESEATRISPNRFTQLTQSNTSGLKQQAENMFKNTQLNMISPLATTPDQSGRAIQDAANLTFRNEVLHAERAAYTAARTEAENITGQAPKTISQAKTLRDNLVKSNPTPEQKPLISFLDGLISDLETTTPASTTPASKLVDAKGKPLVKAVDIAEKVEPTKRSANDLVDLVQRSNQAVNYGGELREQSHRLAPIVATLRQEVGDILSASPQAAQLYQDANLLHARNAQVWGTRYMRSVRFAENPEAIINNTQKASNMRNLKQAIPDPIIQGVAERSVVSKITDSGSAASNRTAINNLAPELSLNARNASQELINVKDPLTTTGGRAAVRNDILKETAKSINTGQRPEKILDLMQTPKGYQIVRESLNGTPQSREVFKSFQRLYMEDIVASVTDKSGVIDFKKAQQVLSNAETRQVVTEIGGPQLLNRFDRLKTFADNFEKNISLYSKPETQSLFKQVASEVKDVGVLTAVLHSLHIPWPIIAGLGLGKVGGKVAKAGYKALERNLLSNPKAMHYMELLSKANTTEELAKQLPRLVAELDKPKD